MEKGKVVGKMLRDEVMKVYNYVKMDKRDAVDMAKFFSQLHRQGLLDDDPRIQNIITTWKTMNRLKVVSELAKEDFLNLIAPDVKVVEDHLTNNNVIPDFKKFSESLEEILESCRPNTEGNVAAYIPQLAKVDPKYLGLSVCTTSG